MVMVVVMEMANLSEQGGSGVGEDERGLDTRIATVMVMVMVMAMG